MATRQTATGALRRRPSGVGGKTGGLGALCLASLACVACAGGRVEATAPPGVSIASITVTSRSFVERGPIPIDHSCDGKDASPSIAWSAPPQGTRSLAVVLDDPDASHGGFTHWIVFNLPPDVLQLSESADIAAAHGSLGANDFQAARYNGPCPPHGETHKYVFRVYALDKTLAIPEGASRAALDAAMAAHVLGEGEVSAAFGH